MWVKLDDEDVAALEAIETPELAELRRRIREQREHAARHADARDWARDTYANDDVEIDDDAPFSVGDTGVWVGGWLFVPNATDDDDEEES